MGHLVHATKAFLLEKAFLNALFATNALYQPGALCRAGMVGLALRQLDRYICAPVPAVKASRPPPVH